jgi:hypothetical protein
MNSQDKKSGDSKLNIMSNIAVILKKYNIDSLIIEASLKCKTRPDNGSSDTLSDTRSDTLSDTRSDTRSYKLFHKLIKKYVINFNFIDIEDMLNVSSLELLAFSYFENYKISKYFNIIASQYIENSKETDIWKNILLKPDYSYYIFKRRKLPYFHIKDANWKRINIDANNEIYNFDNERNKIIKNDNNYISWDVLDFTNNNIINKQILLIKNLFNLGLSFKALHLFINNLLCPTTCHIIKNSSMWEMFKPILTDKNIYDIINYACCYAMYILKHEELIINNKINFNHRFVFTLDEASSIPDFSKSHIENNPHVMQIIGENNIYSSCIFRLVGNRKINGKATFKRRFNLLTGGIFEGINLKELSASITGSILIPCAHTSPLEELFKDQQTRDSQAKDSQANLQNYEFLKVRDEDSQDQIAFLKYSEYFYPSYKSLTDEEYKKSVSKKNSPNKRINYYLKHKQIKYDLADAEENTDSLGAAVLGIGEPDANSSNANNANASNAEKPDTEAPKVSADLSDIDLSITGDIETFIKNTIIIYDAIVKNCKGEVYIEEVTTHSSFKFKIYGPGLTRPIDVFRIPYHPIRMIKQFHVNCVKMYYTDELYLLKSCVSTLLSGVSENYNWISCNKIAAQVFFKYIQKGFTIIFKNSEQKILNKYVVENEHLNKIITYLKITPDKMYCSIKYDNVFFRPHLYGGIRTNLKYINIEKPYTQNKLQVLQFNPLTKYGNIKVRSSNKLNEPNYKLLNNYSSILNAK